MAKCRGHSEAPPPPFLGYNEEKGLNTPPFPFPTDVPVYEKYKTGKLSL